MPGRSRAVIPLAIIGGVAIAAAGVATVVERVIDARRDRSPAPPGTPGIEGRLPVALAPSTGDEPMTAHGLRGWRTMSAALYHRDTILDDGALARAVAIAEHSRRAQDDRRALALEAHVLLGAYEPSLVAAAWLRPLKGVRLDDLAAFGISAPTIATLRAAAQLDAEPELVARWRRELGVDNLRPEVTPQLVADTDSERLGMLWAVLLDLAAERLSARVGA
jgi:hypothetical protein